MKPVQTETAAVTQAETEPPTTVPETEPPIWEYTIGAAGVTFTRWLDTSAAEAVIPDTLEDVPVTEIGANAFAGCTELTSVQFPESVEKIGDQAFAGCKNLSSVLFPDNLVQIGAAAFQDCKALTEIDIPEGMQSVGDGAFSGSGLLSATVPAKFQSSVRRSMPSIREARFSMGEHAGGGCGKDTLWIWHPFPICSVQTLRTPAAPFVR